MTERRTKVRCAIYTRKSSEEGLEQEFNSLDAQREACEAYIASQKHEGWVLLKERYDDGGLSGGTMDRPALQHLLKAIDEGLIDQIVVYKVDRLTRSLPDFSRLIERLDKADASFVSVTQSFNTATSMGRLTLNVLLSFAQFEREVTAERIRDKIAASKKKGMWMGGPVPLGYEAKERTLIAREDEAAIVRQIYDLYLEYGTVRTTKMEADRRGLRSREWTTKAGQIRGGLPYTRGHLYRILTNPIYVGMVHHKGAIYDGQHKGIVELEVWQAVQHQLRIGETRANTDTQDTEVKATDCSGCCDFSTPSPARPKRAYRTEPSPLIGKVFDETGDRLTPSHAKKKERRYRYYISNRLIARSGEREDNEGEAHGKNGKKSAAVRQSQSVGGWRLPASTLENAATDAILSWLAEPTLPARLMIDAGADQQAAMQRKIGQLHRKLAAQDNPIIRLAPTIARINLKPGHLNIMMNAKALADLFGVKTATHIEPGAITICVAFEQRRRGVETRMVLSHTEPQLDAMLISNLAQARSWYAQLKSGSSLATLAGQNNTSVALITRILPLAFLSPSVVEAICTGQQPPNLTSRKLRDITMPADWNEQARLFELV